MISIIIATHNHGAVLAETLDALVPAAIDGLVREVIIADGGSTDATFAIADGYGADVITTSGGMAPGLNAAREAARCQWVLVLPADVRLQPGFERTIASCIARGDGVAAILPIIETSRFAQAASYLRRLWRPRSVTERDGLLIGRNAFARLGGFRPAETPKNGAIVDIRGLDVKSLPAIAQRSGDAGAERGPKDMRPSWRRRLRKSATQTSVT
jgi:glycosyltransferase involved in cell wall biosynthesis